MSRTAWLWVVVVLTTIALAATFLVTPRFPVPVPDAGPPATAFGWSGQLSLVAGDGVRGTRDGAGPQARFDDPFGLVVGDHGVLHIADAGDNNRIRRIAPDGMVSTLADNAGGYAALSLMPAGAEVLAVEFKINLMSPAKVGRNAGKFVVRRLNPRKAQSARVPVIYDRRVSGGLIGHLAGAINGRAVARGTGEQRGQGGGGEVGPVAGADDAAGGTFQPDQQAVPVRHLDEQQAVRAQGLEAVLVEGAVEQAFGRAHRVGGIHDDHVDGLRRGVGHVPDAVIEHHRGATTACRRDKSVHRSSLARLVSSSPRWSAQSMTFR